jgi:hypothetical protein
MKVLYDSGTVLYAQSCAFCHGGNANGKGPDASDLKIPPEDISAVRADRSYLMNILKDGIDGTAMPRFDYYDMYQRESILKYLNEKYDIFSMVTTIPYQITDQTQQQLTSGKIPVQPVTAITAKYQKPDPNLSRRPPILHNTASHLKELSK